MLAARRFSSLSASLSRTLRTHSLSQQRSNYGNSSSHNNHSDNMSSGKRPYQQSGPPKKGGTSGFRSGGGGYDSHSQSAHNNSSNRGGIGGGSSYNKRPRVSNDLLQIDFSTPASHWDVAAQSERDVGVSCYMNSDAVGFTGTFKHRYNDFIVHEIDLEDRVTTYTHQQLPSHDQERAAMKAEQALDTDGNYTALTAIVGEQLAASFVAFVQQQQLLHAQQEAEKDALLVQQKEQYRVMRLQAAAAGSILPDPDADNAKGRAVIARATRAVLPIPLISPITPPAVVTADSINHLCQQVINVAASVAANINNSNNSNNSKSAEAASDDTHSIGCSYDAAISVFPHTLSISERELIHGVADHYANLITHITEINTNSVDHAAVAEAAAAAAADPTAEPLPLPLPQRCIVIRGLPLKPVAPAFVFTVTLDKQQRTALHSLIRVMYSSSVSSDSVDSDQLSMRGSASAAAVTHRAAEAAAVAAETLALSAASAANNSRSRSPERLKAVAAAAAAAATAAAAAASKPATTVVVQSFVRARFAAVIPKASRDSRDLYAWPAATPHYLSFVLHKTNVSTMDALSALALTLRVNVNAFATAGTKDKRAVTTQRVTVHQVTAAKLLAVAAKTRTNGYHSSMAIGNCEYRHTPLFLGSLRGNHFDVVLRDVRGVTEQQLLSVVLPNVATTGFVNYFGLQRFGNTGVGTHLIGQQLLLSNWKKAVELILTPRTAETRDIQHARQQLATDHNITAALRLMPYSMKLERTVLEFLQQHQSISNYLGAIYAMPRAMRLMYVHSWQSFVWNTVVTARLQLLGRVAAVGDLVFVSQSEEQKAEKRSASEAEAAVKAAAAREKESGSKMLDQRSRNANKDRDQKDAATAATEAAEAAEHSSESTYAVIADVRELTQADIDSNSYTIFDIVLPLPGYSSSYPSNMVDTYNTVLQQQQMTLAQFNSNSNTSNKDFSLAGGYRHVVARPTRYSYELLRYDNDEHQLVATDADLVQHRSKARKQAARQQKQQLQAAAGNGDEVAAGAEAKVEAEAGASEESAVSDDNSNNNTSSSSISNDSLPVYGKADGHYLAVKLSFSLPSSTYATMLLRELTKEETTTNFQKAKPVHEDKQQIQQQQLMQQQQLQQQEREQQPPQSMIRIIPWSARELALQAEQAKAKAIQAAAAAAAAAELSSSTSSATTAANEREQQHQLPIVETGVSVSDI